MSTTKPGSDTAFIDAILALMGAVGLLGTDASALERVGASDVVDAITQAYAPPEVVAIMDSPSGFTQRRRIVMVGARTTPRRFDEALRRSLGEAINTVLDRELPLVLPRWAFDQVMTEWLGDMELSATAVISVQRSLILVRGDLMVRVGKVLSDPRAQMVSLREQTVLNLEVDDPRVVLPNRLRVVGVARD